MDRVHNIQTKPWISQKHCNIRELVRERHALLNENHVTLDASAKALDQDPGSCFEELNEKLNAFVDDNRQEVNSYFMFNLTDEKFLNQDEACKLKMYKLQLEHAKKMISDRLYKVSYLSTLKTTRKESLMRHLASANRQQQQQQRQQQQQTSGWDANHESEVIEYDLNTLAVILVVQIWPQPSKNEKLKVEKEILFRSNQYLTELRDHFKCQRDYGVPIDLSDDPEQQAERIFRGELFKSGFFLIEDTFYSDLRDINNTDLSSRIIAWANEEVATVSEDGRNVKTGRGIGPFKRAKMEETKFEDVIFRLGCPYLYFHQGNCEHLFTISDIRYVPNDTQLKETHFPYVTATSIGRKEDHLRCYMCKNRPPHWFTRNNNRLPVDPFFFCETCFLMFNYDEHRQKIGQFQAYLYTSASGIPDSIVMGDGSK